MKRYLTTISIILVACFMFLPCLNALASSASGESGVWLDFSTATDEELEQAIVLIKTEQRARLKTKILFDVTELSLGKGKNAKITAEVIDIPEGLQAGKITWSSSDEKVATCQQGTVRGIGNGTAIITATCTLSDGTEISNELTVTVFTPVSGLNAGNKNINIGVGESVETSITIQPQDATNTTLEYTSSDTSVATVSESGVITGVGVGKATITATTTDGSEKSVSFAVTASKKDDRGKTKTDSHGIEVTVYGFKETKGKSYAKPEAGNTFVLIETEIVNNTTSEITISSVLSFDAYCDGYTLDYSFSAVLNTSNQMDGSIAPGKKMKGQVALEVPQNWKEIELHCKPDYWSGSEVVFVIYNQ